MASTLAISMPGGWEWAIIILVVLLLFGGKKLPELARGVGRGMRIFRDELKGVKSQIDLDDDEDETPASKPKKLPKRTAKQEEPEEEDEQA